jgi:hypothetical protein
VADGLVEKFVSTICGFAGAITRINDFKAQLRLAIFAEFQMSIHDDWVRTILL